MEAEFTSAAGQCRVLRPRVPEADFVTRDVEFSWSIVSGLGCDDVCCVFADPEFRLDFE
jgi:hypothetical protein